MPAGLRIDPFKPGDAAAFRDINLEWISRYFVVEAKDREALDNPEASILAKGGRILIARLDGEPVGAVALIPMPDATVELAKMGVRPQAQGKGVGRRIIAAALATAGEMGARRVYLETNSILGPALKLYEDAGFRRVQGPPSPYARADVQMELVLDPAPG